jgi:ABC-2 type transport system ATP-binding protein
MTTETIAATALRKSYGHRLALCDVSFAAGPGEVVGLLGPNGAGKTTTIRLLSTVLAPDAGRFHIAGIPHTEPRAVRRHLGVLPESFGYPQHQTGREYLTFFARLHGANRIDARGRADNLLAEVGLTDRAASRVGTYSRGLRQRLGIARALVNDPAVLLLDEPGLGLDPAGQREINAIITKIVDRRAVTVLLSTHSLPDVEQLCSRIVILMAGRVVTSGTVAEVTAAAAAAAPPSATLRVPPAQLAAARHAIQTAIPRAMIDADAAQPGGLRVTMPDGRGRLSAALDAVLSADLDVLAFEIQATRLSDAFFAATEEVRS